jgi:molybdate transport system regulatory protein
MKLQVRVSFYSDGGEKFFGEGPYRLLCGISRCGSLRAACQSMDMAYTKALRLLSRAERHCGFPLTCRTIGGSGGGGSVLTREAEELLKRYESFQSSCGQLADRLYQTTFSGLWPEEPAPDRTAGGRENNAV